MPVELAHKRYGEFDAYWIGERGKGIFVSWEIPHFDTAVEDAGVVDFMLRVRRIIDEERGR